MSDHQTDNSEGKAGINFAVCLRRADHAIASPDCLAADAPLKEEEQEVKLNEKQATEEKDDETKRNSISSKTPPQSSANAGGKELSEKVLEAGLSDESETIIVDWDGPDDPANPRK